MFVGHYAVALAAKPLTPKISLGWTFLAVQFLDILWGPAILFGIEHARIVPGYLPASNFVFYDFPWTHSLLMAMGWSWLVFRISKSAILGGCVFSHWALDWVAHAHDLPLYRGGPVVGLGLWHFRTGTYVVEAAMLLLGLWIYLRWTRPAIPAGRFAMPAFAALLLAVNAANLYGPSPSSIKGAAIAGEAAFLVIAGIAWRLDRMREPLPEEPPVKLGLTEQRP
jgi:hypothetical protein